MTMAVMKLTDVLASLDETEKVASVETSPRSRVREELAQALSDESEKTASEGEVDEGYESSPVADLEKMASDLSNAEEEALVKEAQIYGAAVCDGFMARLAVYEQAAQNIEPSSDDSFTQNDREEKVASVYADIEPEAVEMAEDLIKEAADAGYELSEEEAFEKVAEEAYNKGYNDVVAVAEQFEEAYGQGYEETIKIAQEVEAAYDQGYEETIKLAADAEEAYDQGYEDVMAHGQEVLRDLGFEETLEKAAEMLQEAGEEEVLGALVKTAFDQGYEDAMEKIAESAFAQGMSDMAQLLEQTEG
jgi:hypothetical protein